MKKILVTALALFSATVVLATPPKPSACPGVDALKTTQFEAVGEESDGLWSAGVMRNSYDTKEQWTFLMGKITATNEQEAMENAMKGLKSVRYQSGPTLVEDFDMWFCDYVTKEGYEAVAITPPLDMDLAKKIAKFK